jgi:hypothetical protein
VLENFVAFAPVGVPERLPMEPIGPDNPHIPVLDRNIARDFLKDQAVSFLAFLVLFLELLDFGDVGRHLHNGDNLAGFIADGGGVDNDCDFITIERFYQFLALVPQAITECTFDGADLAPFRAVFVHLIAVTPLVVPESFPEGPVGVNNPKVSVLDRNKTRHLLEILLVGTLHYSPLERLKGSSVRVYSW